MTKNMQNSPSIFYTDSYPLNFCYSLIKNPQNFSNLKLRYYFSIEFFL